MSNEKMKNENRSMSKRRFRSGAYSTILAVVVIAVVLLVNLFIGELGLSLDLTAENRYTLTEETNQLVTGLKDEVTIYYLVQEGNQQKILEKIINQYGAFNKINVVIKDPVLYPAFAKEYTEKEIQQNDVIVVNENTKTSRYISVNEMLIQEMDYYSQTQSVTLDAEGQITAAIQYVTNEDFTKMYVVTGHNEIAVGAEFTKFLQKASVQTEELETSTVEAIPEDCEILFVNGPAYDFSEHELGIVMDYLEKGGKAVLTTQYTTQELTNYKTLLNHYGVDVVDGIVLEAQGHYYQPYLSYLKPILDEDHEIVTGLSTEKILLMPESKGFHLVENHRGSLTVEGLMTTSEGSFSRTDVGLETAEKQETDVTGPFYLGIAATDTFKDFETKVVVFAGANMFDDGFFTSGQYINGDVFLNAAQWLTGNQSSSIVVPTRSLSETYLVIPGTPRVMIAVATIFVIPVGLLLVGFFIWFVRRKS